MLTVYTAVAILVHYLLQRWYFNATIECFNNTGHIILGLWAIMVLLICFLFVPFVGIVSKEVLQVSIQYLIPSHVNSYFFKCIETMLVESSSSSMHDTMVVCD